MVSNSECHNCAHPVEAGSHYCPFCGVYQGGSSEIALLPGDEVNEASSKSSFRPPTMRTYPFEIYSLLLFCAVFAVAWLIWPTPYRYDHLQELREDHPVRTNRVTGQVQILSYNGWEPLGDADQKPIPSLDLPPTDLSALTGSSNLQLGTLKCDVYNGSHWVVNEITVLIEIKDRNGGVIFSRRYRMLGTSRPLSNTEFSADTGITWQAGWTWAWSIVGAKGQKAV